MNGQKPLQTLQIIHFAMLSGQVMFAGVLFFLRDEITITQTDDELANLFKILVPVLGFGGLLGGNFVFKSFMKKALTSENIGKKMDTYRVAFLIRSALLEGPSLFTLVAFLLTSDVFFIGFAIILMVIFTFLRPTAAGIIQDLELSGEERNAV